MQKITPFLWFNGNAEEAIQFYTAVFKNTTVLNIARYPEGAPMPAGTVMSASIIIEGQQFTFLNGGPQYSFTPATSFFVHCDSQEEVDSLWAQLTDGGSEMQCGWLTDKFGITWQIIPKALGTLLSDPDKTKAQKAMMAMFKMKKIDIATLEQAFNA